ncbi:MAG: GNAT family N-acetyltransferase [Rubrivivax sp.]
MSAAPSMFSTAQLGVRALQAHEVPALQALFDAHPEYFLAVNGRRARPDEARQEFDERPPPHLPWRRHHHAGVHDAQGALVGTLVFTEGLCDEQVCHLGLFWLMTPLHGRGLAGPLHEAWARWAQAQGARWLRLSVIAGNARAEAFWARLGYTEVRRRLGIDTGGRINDARVMIRALDGAAPAEYLARVPRDHPDSTLP